MRRPAFLCRILFVGDPALGERQRPVIAPISLDRTPHIEAIAPHPRTSLVPPAPARAKNNARNLHFHPPDVWRTILQMSGPRAPSFALEKAGSRSVPRTADILPPPT